MKTRSELERQVDRLRAPFSAFISAQTTASAMLLAALSLALWMANSDAAGLYTRIREFEFGVLFGGHEVRWPLLHLVNDGLIALFFFLIGLEVKRELLVGELADAQRVRLLLGAALGGMLLPAAIYLSVNAIAAEGAVHGWGIPMATDTAIAIGVLAALGRRVPSAAVAFLVGLAIVDDIGAILVIAVFYTEQLAPGWLGLAGLLMLAMALFNGAGLRHPLLYLAAGIALWVAVVQSGVHASIAGVAAAAMVPARPRLRPGALKRRLSGVLSRVPSDAAPEQVLGEARTHRRINEVERLAHEGTTPLRRWEDAMELPVALLVLPLFVFLNAGVPVSTERLSAALTDPVALGVALGLLVGKPVGILGGVWLSERLAGATRPPELGGRRLLGLGMLAGIGFTMSTFIANLALGDGDGGLVTAKLAILGASGLAALAGYLTLWAAAREPGASAAAPERGRAAEDTAWRTR